MITFAAMYHSPHWRGPMVVAYGLFERYPSHCEWIVPGSDREHPTPPLMEYTPQQVGERG